MTGSYIYNSKKKKNSFFKVFIILLLVFNSIGLAVVQSKNSKISTENSTLQNEIENIKVETEQLLAENNKLSESIKEKEEQYKEAAKNLKIAYLTFDDGPSGNTEDILSILDSYKVKATFFVNGHDKYKDKYSKIVESGHKIALHSYTHDYKDIYKSVDSFKNDNQRLKDYITELTGKVPDNILRYPGGSTNTISRKYGGTDIMKSIIDAMRAENYVYYDWNVDSGDASGNRVPKDTIAYNVLSQANNKKNAIILLHDTNAKDTTVQALPAIIEGLISQGFTFDVLSADTSVK